MNPLLAYSEMKPAGIEGNQFSYHLKTLVTRGYVKHQGNKYALTTKGVHYSTSVNLEHFFVRIQPKIVTLIVCRNDRGEYLTYTRNKQPFFRMTGFPYGKIHLGETIEHAAVRELKEKAGLTATLTHKGIAYLLTRDPQGEVLAHILAHVFLAEKPAGETAAHANFGTIRWLSEDELLSEHTMPGVREVLTIAKNKHEGLVFEEYEFQQA